ncbi:hypothetical protein KCU88_g3426, partial [Aureobasidium melanogenum]
MGHPQRFIGHKTGQLLASEQVPDYGGLSHIVGNDESSSTGLTDTIGSDQLYILGMLLEPLLDRQRVMLKTYDGRALRK